MEEAPWSVGNWSAAGWLRVWRRWRHPAAEAAAAEDEEIARVARSLEELRQVYERDLTGPNLDELRRQQRAFLKSHQKYPDFVEVGVDVWRSVQWHVKNQQPLVARMMADGRHAITFMFTTVIMRADQPDTYVGYLVRRERATKVTAAARAAACRALTS